MLTYRCDRSWSSLAGEGPRRHCDRCDRVVHDLDALTPEHRGRVLLTSACVRFLTVALLTADVAHAEPDVRPGEGPLPIVEPVVMGALDRTVIDEVIRAASPTLATAYTERRKDRPDLRGKLVVKLTVARGLVTAASVSTSTIDDHRFEQMVLDVLQTLVFEKMKAMDGVVVVSYPFLFEPPTKGRERGG